MATLTIRNLDDPLKSRLRLRAAANDRSMEEEARQILRAALSEASAPAGDLGQRIRARFASLGGVELEVPPREPVRPPPTFAAAPSKRPRRTTAASRSVATRR